MPDITITLATLISVISVSAAVFFGIKSKKRADDEDVTKRAETITRLTEKMDALTKSFNDFATDIKIEIRDMRDSFTKVNNEQIKQATLIEQLEHRIEKLEGV
ncbi:MAG: hypothetical protein J6S67_09410 [Methanobrevibacter sp.]|nr:hypothetical protein [Methanobrevibacter sp.]